jgi:sn-glycerol 3-phosphate transport system ATP-binding protein
MATVNLVNLSKQVGQTSILDKVNVTVAQGEFLVVIGPSGCGKSTLLRLVAGLEPVSFGQVLMNNRCCNEVPAAQRDIAMVFQNYALYPHMSVFDNMAYGLKMRRLKKEEITKKVMDTAKLLQLEPFLARKPQQLSGGQKQRVAMGRALVRSPSVFLFDEPLSNLDTKLRTEMRHEIKRLHQRFNTTSLYVTHDQTEAMTMADRVLVLNKGAVEQLGTPSHLYQFPASIFVAGFTGHYPINFFAGTVDKEAGLLRTSLGIHYPLPKVLQAMAHRTELVLAIRPEHVQVVGANHPHALSIQTEFIDDMGADKLIQARCKHNKERLSVRVLSDERLFGEALSVALPENKVHLFYKQTGKRIGEMA